MISRGRRGGALLLGLATGAALVSGAVAAPAGVVPASWQAALGKVTPEAQPPPAAWSAVPPPVRLRTIPPATTVPPTTTTPQPTTARPSRAGEPRPADPLPVLTPPAMPDPAPRVAAGVTAAVVTLTNVARSRVGCPALDTDDRLATAAQRHASDMAEQGYFSHVGLDGREFDDRIRAAGHAAPGGENIARGQEGAAEVVEAWMDSPGHRRNIEDCSFASIGVGFDGRGNYWVQNFGR